MTRDCKEFVKVPTVPVPPEVHIAIAPIPTRYHPFVAIRGLGIDIIGTYENVTAREHKDILAATDYFSK